jgi:hypothetical protein
MNGYIDVARFFHAEPMEACLSILRQAGIQPRIADDSQTTNLSVWSPGTISCGLVSVPKDQLIDAREALLQAAREEVAAGVDSEHPLLACKDSELTSMLKHPWENSDFEMACAERILQERNVPAPEITFARADERAEEMVLPQEGIRRGSGTFVGYIILSAFSGGLIGLILAWNLAFSTEIAPDGSKRYVYCESSRIAGKWLLVLSLILLIGIMAGLKNGYPLSRG